MDHHKHTLIQNAQPHEKYRRPSPLQGLVFPELNFFDFTVTQNGNPIKLHTYRWQVAEKPRSIVFLFHGLNSHLGNYAHVAKPLAEKAGAAVVGFDFRGFGRSQGKRAVIEGKEQHFSDCVLFVKMVREMYEGKYGKLPYFFAGQSLGGMTAYNLGLKHFPDVNGTVLLAPALKDNPYNARVGKMFLPLLKWLMPERETVGQKGNQDTKNPQIKEEREKDPYAYHGGLIPCSIKMILDCEEELMRTFEEFKCPFLMVQGGVDKLVDPFQAEELMAKSKSADKTLIFKENMWHNVVMEEEIAEILPEVVGWVDKRS